MPRAGRRTRSLREPAEFAQRRPRMPSPDQTRSDQSALRSAVVEMAKVLKSALLFPLASGIFCCSVPLVIKHRLRLPSELEGCAIHGSIPVASRPRPLG